MDKQEALALFSRKLSEWEQTPKIDAYHYEASFDEFMQSLSQDLFQLSVGELAQDRNAKKK
jgi:hypothetical protein